jgi:hypothetical protein
VSAAPSMLGDVDCLVCSWWGMQHVSSQIMTAPCCWQDCRPAMCNQICCRHHAEETSCHVGMMTMNQLDAASLRKTWDREVQDFRTTCQVSSRWKRACSNSAHKLSGVSGVHIMCKTLAAVACGAAFDLQRIIEVQRCTGKHWLQVKMQPTSHILPTAAPRFCAGQVYHT